MVTIIRVGKPTDKGTQPLLAMLEGHGLLSGWAASGKKVAVGDVLGLETVAHSESGFWVWVA